MIIYSGLLGLLIASFLNVVIYRLPQGETIVQGRSHCMTCGHSLNALDLIPVFSYLFLRRRCRYCQAPISSRYLVIELSGGVFFTLAAIVYLPFDNLNSFCSLLVLCSIFCLLLADSMIRFDGHPQVPKLITVGCLLMAAVPLLHGILTTDSASGEFVSKASGLALGLMAIPMLRVLFTMLHPAEPSERSSRMLILALPVAGLWLGFPSMLLVLLPTAVVIRLLPRQQVIPLTGCIFFSAAALFSAVF